MIGLLFVLGVIRGWKLEYDLEITETENYGQTENYGLTEEWLVFKKQQNKNYDFKEEQVRYEIFKMNYAKIVIHNKLFDERKVSYRMGVNQFTDQTLEERILKYTGLKYEKNEQYQNESDNRRLEDNLDYPATVDWRDKNVVTPVKNQGQCGSCYSFSATGSMEGQYAIKNKHLISLSEQNIVDCSYSYGNSGCSGGLMNQCFDYVKGNGGIDTEEMYPYVGKEGSCKYKQNPFPLSSYNSIAYGNENSLKAAVAQFGPISVGIQVRDDFMSYSGGVFSDPGCDPYILNHGVLVVGYGVEDGHDYWLVKNSWGASWGLNGYIKMSRNKNNQCGIASAASYPVL